MAPPFAKYDDDDDNNNNATDVIRRKRLRRRRRRSTSLNLSANHPSSPGKTPGTSSRNRKKENPAVRAILQVEVSRRPTPSAAAPPPRAVDSAIWGRDAPLDIRWEATATEGEAPLACFLSPLHRRSRHSASASR